MEIFSGFSYLFLITAVMTAIGTLIGDIGMMIKTGIPWKESIRCGWLYFIDRFHDNTKL